MDKLQRDYTIDSIGPLPNDWEVTPVQKERMYTESEMIKYAQACMNSVGADSFDITTPTVEEWEKTRTQVPNVDRLELREILPIGKFIIDQKDISGIPGNDGMYYHYTDVCKMLKRFNALGIIEQNKYN